MKTFRTFIIENEGAPANNTTSGPGMGSDNSLHMKKMRMWKTIHRRHRIPEAYVDGEELEKKGRYTLQPSGTWKKGGDSRTERKTKTELEKMGVHPKRIQESETQLKKAGVSGYNQPKASAHADKSHVVVAKEGEKTKLIRFGQRGVKGSPEGSKRNQAFKARHSKNIAKGKMSAAYWANKVKW